MKSLTLIFIIFLHFCFPVLAQKLELSQSSPEIDWKTVSNKRVKLIYPDFLNDDSIYISNLVEHYGKVVGETYGIENPEQFSLVLRPEKANLNGFVTLAPRRSEWFSSASFTPILGGADFYQTLSIHEYRHVIQFDHFNQGFVKGMDYLFGDFGIQISSGLGLQPWYFEGDAVWAETKYTDAGRGRSPRFLSRLKALVLSNQIPTYDEFVNGTYNNSLPNHYVLGYVLVTNATNKFGDDFWHKVVRKVSSFPHPWRLLSSFESVSGMDFFEFYDLTMNELKNKWSDDLLDDDTVAEFREKIEPKSFDNRLLYLTYDLNNFWQIMERKNNIEKLIAEIPFYKSLTQISFSSTHAVFNQFRPDSRYEYKETSELTLVDLSNGSLRTLVSNKRLYNPSFNKQGNKIFAVEFDKKHNWKLVEFDLDGKELRRLKIKGHRIVEVQYIDDSEIVVLVLNKVGEKSIQLINLHSNKSRTLLPYSRNSIAGLNVDKKSNIFFEAQQNGKINIFKINHNKNISKCSNEKIGAYFPSSDGRTLFYSKQDSSGSTIAKRPIKKCKRIKLKSLIGFNYLGKSPSDNFGEHVLVHLPDQKKMFNKGKNTTKPQDYETFDKRLLIPHSWNFFTGRGFGLSINTDNYLNTMGLSAEVGQNSEEKQLYYGADLSFKKYYPIFSLGAHKTAREVDLFNTSSNLKWDEIDIDLSMTLPLLYSKNLKTLVSAITLGGKTLEVSNYKEIEPEIKRENQEFNNPYVQFTTSFSKDKKLRSIEVPWGISYVGLYENAHNSSDSSLSSYQFYQSIELFTTGLFSFDGLRFTFNSEKQKDDNKSYKFSPIGSKSGDYVFSRGYDYIFVPEYDKYTANYFFPIAYPDWRIWGLAYFKQLKANLFYDYTNIEHKYWKSKIESTGVELEFESKFFRVIPIDFGFRYVHKISSKENVGEFYLGTSITN